MFDWREKFFALCDQDQVSPAVACVQFGISHRSIISVVLGTSKPIHIKDNLEAVTAEIPPAFWGALLQAGLISPDYAYLS